MLASFCGTSRFIRPLAACFDGLQYASANVCFNRVGVRYPALEVQGVVAAGIGAALAEGTRATTP